MPGTPLLVSAEGRFEEDGLLADLALMCNNRGIMKSAMGCRLGLAAVVGVAQMVAREYLLAHRGYLTRPLP